MREQDLFWKDAYLSNIIHKGRKIWLQTKEIQPLHYLLRHEDDEKTRLYLENVAHYHIATALAEGKEVTVSSEDAGWTCAFTPETNHATRITYIDQSAKKWQYGSTTVRNPYIQISFTPQQNQLADFACGIDVFDLDTNWQKIPKASLHYTPTGRKRPHFITASDELLFGLTDHRSTVCDQYYHEQIQMVMKKLK